MNFWQSETFNLGRLDRQSGCSGPSRPLIGQGNYPVKQASSVQLALVALMATILVSSSGCGGANDYDVDEYDGYVPYITELSPNSGRRGTTVDVVISGNNLHGNNLLGVKPRLTVSGIGVTATIPVDSGQPRAIFTIAADAPLGPRTVTVHHGGGSGGGVDPGDNIFTVTAAPDSGGGGGS